MSQDIRIIRVGHHWARSLKVTVIQNDNHTISPEMRDALAAALKRQGVTKVQFDIGGLGRVEFERNDPDFPQQLGAKTPLAETARRK